MIFFVVDGHDSIVHYIKDGKLNFTKHISDISTLDELSSLDAYSYYGELLNISNTEELREYPVKIKERLTTIVSLRKKYKPSHYNMVEVNRLRSDYNSEYSGILNYFYEVDFKELNLLLNSFSIDLNISKNELSKSKVILEGLIKNEEKIKVYILNKIDELFDRFYSNLEAENLELDKVLNPYLEEFSSKWFKKRPYEKEERLGEYIHIINKAEKLRMEAPEHYTERNEKEKELYLRETKEYIESNTSILENYLLWLQPSEEDMSLIDNAIKKVCD